MFVEENDGPVEKPVQLEEFYVTFYDFDQDWADGNKSFVRETLLIGGWDVMFVNRNHSMETRFSYYLPLLRAIGGLPLRTCIELDDNYEPKTFTGVYEHGTMIRSSVHGTGPPYTIKSEYERCEGMCSVREAY